MRVLCVCVGILGLRQIKTGINITVLLGILLGKFFPIGSGVTEEERALRHIWCGAFVHCCHYLTDILYLYSIFIKCSGKFRACL